MIKAASSRAILLIFSSFLPAWAVGVVGNASFVHALIHDVPMAIIFYRFKRIHPRHSLSVVLVPTPRQRQGKQSEEG